MADSWIRPFDASYDFVRVSRETGLELDFVRDIENGGSIERNANTALYETASLDFADKFDVGNDFLRVYLNATFTTAVRGASASEHSCRRWTRWTSTAPTARARSTPTAS